MPTILSARGDIEPVALAGLRHVAPSAAMRGADRPKHRFTEAAARLHPLRSRLPCAERAPGAGRLASHGRTCPTATPRYGPPHRSGRPDLKYAC